jgi:fused signal recognition particle receptor
MKKIALLLTLAVLIIGCSKTDPKQDTITKTETVMSQQEMSKLEAEKLEAARMEAAKIEAARIEAARLEAARMKAAEMEAAKIKAAEMEAARLEAAEMKAANMKAAAASKMDDAAGKISKVVEPTADSIEAVMEETVDDQIMEDEATSKAMEEVVVEEPVVPAQEKSSKGLLFGFGALAAAVVVYFVSKKK